MRIPALLALGALLALTGCAEKAVERDEAAFLEKARGEQGVSADELSDAQLIKWGDTLCKIAAEPGKSMADATDQAMTQAMNGESASALTWGAVGIAADGTLC